MRRCQSTVTQPGPGGCPRWRMNRETFDAGQLWWVPRRGISQKLASAPLGAVVARRKDRPRYLPRSSRMARSGKIIQVWGAEGGNVVKQNHPRPDADRARTG